MEGGLRSRMVADSVHYFVRSTFDSLGWFDTGRQHAPVTLIERDPGETPEVPPVPTTVAVFDEDVDATDAEMGSALAEDRWTYYADFYAENDSIGRHMSGDLKGALEGRMPSIGRTHPYLSVIDFSLATPAVAFTCAIRNVVRDRGHDDTRAWRRHWWVVRFDLIDTY